MLLALLAGGLPLIAAMATNTLHQRAAPRVVVSLFVDKATKGSSVMVTDESKTKIYGHSCASALALGSLNIAYDVDQYGSGTLRIGSAVYTVHSDPALSGGIECGIIYDDSETHVNCVAPWPAAGPELVELPTSATRQPCLDDHLSRRAAFELDEVAADAPFTSRDVHPESPAGQSGKRQVTCMPVPVTRLVGNGNPHQNFQHTQLSVRLPGPNSVTIGYLGS